MKIYRCDRELELQFYSFFPLMTQFLTLNNIAMLITENENVNEYLVSSILTSFIRGRQ